MEKQTEAACENLWEEGYYWGLERWEARREEERNEESKFSSLISHFYYKILSHILHILPHQLLNPGHWFIRPSLRMKSHHDLVWKSVFKSSFDYVGGWVELRERCWVLGTGYWVLGADCRSARFWLPTSDFGLRTSDSRHFSSNKSFSLSKCIFG